MLIGYVRSDDPQTIRDASGRMEEAGCTRTLIDAAGVTARAMTPSLEALVSTLKPNDRLTVTRLSDLAPMPELISVLATLVDGRHPDFLPR